MQCRLYIILQITHNPLHKCNGKGYAATIWFTAYCTLPTATAYCLMPTADCRLLLHTANCLLHTAHCLLPTAYCLLRTAYCLLPTATADCLLLLPTVYCLLNSITLIEAGSSTSVRSSFPVNSPISFTDFNPVSFIFHLPPGRP